MASKIPKSIWEVHESPQTNCSSHIKMLQKQVIEWTQTSLVEHLHKYFQTKSADCVMGFKTECIFYFFCSVLTIVNGIPQRRGSNVCIVSEAGSGLDKPCQFPFVYKDKSYNECTLEDGGGVAWCSTKTIPSTNEHVGRMIYYLERASGVKKVCIFGTILW